MAPGYWPEKASGLFEAAEPSDAAKWTRGENPATTMGPGNPGFSLPRPRWMREPGTNLGTAPMAHHRDKMGNKITLSPGSPNLSGSS